MSIYAYEKSFGISHYGLGSAIALVMLLLMLSVTFFYIRQMVRIGEVEDRHRDASRGGCRFASGVSLSTSPGLLVFVVMVFPVYWMVATAFKPGVEITSYTPKWIPTHPDARALHRRDPAAVLLGERPQQPDRRQRRRRAFGRAGVPRRGRAGQVPLHRPQGVHRPDHPDPDAAGERADHPAVRRARPLPPGEHSSPGVIITYLTFVLPFSVWTLRGFIIGIPRDLEEAAMVDGSTAASAPSSRSCCRSSRRASSRPRSSRSSRPGTSSSSPTSCSTTRRSRR